MLPFIQRVVPSRRIRVANKERLALSLITTVLLLCTITYPFYRKPANKMADEIIQKPYTVGHGDTYWQISKALQADGYKKDKDIREVVHDLVKWSGIKAHELKEGDIILLPFLFDSVKSGGVYIEDKISEKVKGEGYNSG